MLIAIERDPGVAVADFDHVVEAGDHIVHVSCVSGPPAAIGCELLAAFGNGGAFRNRRSHCRYISTCLTHVGDVKGGDSLLLRRFLGMVYNSLEVTPSSARVGSPGPGMTSGN